MHLRLSQQGDTIVEVLVAISIASLILGGAYVTSHNSLIATRDSQEHANALQIAQGQIEWLRADAAQSNSQIFTQASGFCIADVVGGSIKTGAACKVDTTGTHSATAADDIYNVSIARSSPNANGSVTFTVSVKWPSLQNLSDEIQLLYRTYQS